MPPKTVSKGGVKASVSSGHCTCQREKALKAQVREALWDFGQEQWDSITQRNGRDLALGIWYRRPREDGKGCCVILMRSEEG